MASSTKPKGIAIAPDGSLAYVSLMTKGKLLIIDLATDTVRGETRLGDSPERTALYTLTR